MGAKVLQTIRQRALPQDTIALFQMIGGVPIVGTDRALQEQMTLLAGRRAGGGPGHRPRREGQQRHFEVSCRQRRQERDAHTIVLPMEDRPLLFPHDLRLHVLFEEKIGDRHPQHGGDALEGMQGRASIMASATPFWRCATPKRLAAKSEMNSKP